MKDNKLIAEFMGVEHVKMFRRALSQHTFDGAQYHTSWYWLMEVVDKIENLGYDVIIRQGTCEIQTKSGNIFECFDASKHITTYTAVVEFIKWYNENN